MNTGKDGLLNKVEENVRKYGLAVIYVGGERGRCSFTYTVGLADRGHPEIIVSNLPYAAAHGALNELGRNVQRGVVYGADELIAKVFNVPVMSRRVERRDELTAVANRYHRLHGRESWDLLQLVWPDPWGSFPWDKGYDVGCPQECFFLQDARREG